MLCGGKFNPLNTYFFCLFRNKSDDFLYVYLHQKSLKSAVETSFLVSNNHLNLCGQVENSKWSMKST